MTEAGNGNTPEGTNAGANPPAGNEGGQPAQGGTPQIDAETVLNYLKDNPDVSSKIIQPHVDSAISKYVQKNTELTTQLEQFQNKGKTELEIANINLKKSNDKIAELENKINNVTLESYKNSLLPEYGLTKEDLPYLIGGTPEEIENRAKNLQKRYQAIGESVKNDLLKNASGVPNAGGTAGAKNPFNDDSWSPQEQLTLANTNPKLYGELRAAAKANPANSKIKL